MEENIKRKFESFGYHDLTPIQEQVYDPMVSGKDVLGLSPTGSGKTVAFLMPIIANLSAKTSGVQVMILEPSQELAIQTTNVVRNWLSDIPQSVLALTGGANIKRQIEKLKQKPAIIVGTPGRILNLVDDRKLKLEDLKTVVIDEADDLLQGETLSTIREIIEAGPARVQLTYFSATDTAILHDLHTWFGRSPLRIDVRKIDHSSGPVKHRWLNVSQRKRNQILKRLLHIKDFKALVFFQRMSDLTATYSFFHHAHLTQVESLTSNQNQVQRQKSMKGFRTGKIKLLLTTDVAARGLDIPHLPAVINYDLPSDRNGYIHRTGRTGRMGEDGLVLNFGDDHDIRDLRKLLTNTDYDIKPIYFDQNRLTEVKPKEVKRTVEKSAKDKKRSRQPNPNSRKSINKKLDNMTGGPAKRPLTKKQLNHRKHKHTKNKGMRKKWRDQDQKNI